MERAQIAYGRGLLSPGTIPARQSRSPHAGRVSPIVDRIGRKAEAKARRGSDGSGLGANLGFTWARGKNPSDVLLTCTSDALDQMTGKIDDLKREAGF